MNHGDVKVRQIHARVQCGDLGGVPFGDFAEMDASDDISRQLQLTGCNTIEVKHRNNTTDDRRELHQTLFLEFFGLERHVGGTKIDRLGLDLTDAAARADRLIVQSDASGRLVGLGPLGINWVREGCACASKVSSLRRQGNSQPCGKSGNTFQNQLATHSHSWFASRVVQKLPGAI